MEEYRQLSLFDLVPGDQAGAINLMSGEMRPTLPMADWMERLVPGGEFLIMVGKYPCVLRRTDLRRVQVKQGHEFYHYDVGGAIYAGVFVGEDDCSTTKNDRKGQ